MIALDAALRRLTVCQLTGESRGNGGGLARGCGSRLRAAAWGQILPVWHEKRTQKLLCMGLFSKKLHGRRRPRHGYKKQRKRTNHRSRWCRSFSPSRLAVARISQPRSNHQKPGRGIAQDFEIRPVVVHPTKRADLSRHGYRAAQFEDAFARFLPPEPNIRTLKRGAAKRRESVRMFDDCARCGTAKVDRMPTNG